MAMISSVSTLLLPRVYEDIWYRGEAYADRGKVELVSVRPREARAIVDGAERYTVVLALSGKGLVRTCTCPYAKSGAARTPACKHMVALAIVWDEKRNFPRPKEEDIRDESLPAPLVTRYDLERASHDPLHANLEVVRLFSAEQSGGSRAHARLPLAPRATYNQDEPTLLEAKEAFREVRKYSRAPLFDDYFCAGEVCAGLCEYFRSVLRRSRHASSETIAQVAQYSIEQIVSVIGEEVDDADNLLAFAAAHLDALVQMAQSKNKKEQSTEADSLIWGYNVRRKEMED